MHVSYFAGLFDGEGTVGIYSVRQEYWSVRMQIVGTHKPMIKALYDFVGDGSFTIQSKQKNYKQGWKWCLSNRSIIKRVLLNITPYLIEKKEQAQIVIDYLDGNLDGRVASSLCKEAKQFSFPFNKEDIMYCESKYIPWNKGKKGVQQAWNKGKKGVSEETRERMRLSALKRHAKNNSN